MNSSSRIITSLLCSIVGLNSMLTVEAARPKLVVGIVVDQLRTDYIDFLQAKLSDRGFQRLMQQGVTFKDVDFGVDRGSLAAGTAMAVTGAFPYSTGITGDRIYNLKEHRFNPAIQDPSALLLPTLSDEIAIDGAGLGAVYSIAPDAQQAIIMGGHAANSAVWIDDNTGKWTSTSYYRETPAPVSARNYRSPLSLQVDTISWKPLLDLSQYEGLPAQKRYYPFMHTFPRADRNVYRMVKQSPIANREVTDMAIDYLDQLRLGRRGDVIDMLNVGYTLAPYKYVKDGDYRLELQDAYLRLDRQLERLLDAVEKNVGLDNAVIYLSSTGYYDDASPNEEQYRLPGGEFSLKRMQALLNSYLSAKYGNGNYIDAIAGQEIYLDRSQLELRRIDPAAVLQDAREFLCKMSGVADAYTLQEILTQGNEKMQRLRRQTDARNAGDILVEMMPGWTVVDDIDFSEKPQTARSSMVNTPAFILAPNVEARTVTSSVEATALAPTVASILRIRSPGGAVKRPIVLQ